MKGGIKDKSFAFAIRVIRLYKILVTEKREYVLSKQLLKSGTAIGASEGRRTRAVKSRFS